MNLGWLRFTGWITAWMVLVLLPMAIALTGPLPEVRTRLHEAAAMLGFLALGMLAMQSVVSGRQRWFARGLGQDDLLQFHRRTGEIAWMLVLAHPLAMLVADPELLAYLDPRVDLLRAGSLWLVLVAASVLLASSLWRTRFGLSYEHWRLLHGVLALLVVSLALGHALLVDHYTAGMWKKLALLMVVGAALWLIVETRTRRPWRQRGQPWTVIGVTAEAAGASTLRLRADGHAGMRFVPGQFAWLSLGESPWQLQQHPFSMTSPADQAELWFTIKPAGDFTGAVAGTRIGSRAWIEGPYGVFTWQPGFAPRGAVFVAGGVGITPFLSMLRTAGARRSDDRIWLFYANSDVDSIIARDELDAIARELPLTVVHVLDDPPDDWDGERGHIDAAMLDRHLPSEIEGLLAYVCGPEPLANAVEPVLLARGIPAKNLYSERFDMV